MRDLIGRSFKATARQYRKACDINNTSFACHGLGTPSCRCAYGWYVLQEGAVLFHRRGVSSAAPRVSKALINPTSGLSLSPALVVIDVAGERLPRPATSQCFWFHESLKYLYRCRNGRCRKSCGCCAHHGFLDRVTRNATGGVLPNSVE